MQTGANAIDDSPGRFKLPWQKRESRKRCEWRVMLGDLVASVSEGIQPSRRSCYQALAPLESSAARKERELPCDGRTRGRPGELRPAGRRRHCRYVGGSENKR